MGMKRRYRLSAHLKIAHVFRIRQTQSTEQPMTRLFAAILVLGLVTGCSTYFKTNDEIAISGQGVLASYEQSVGEPTDVNRVNVSVNKRRMKPTQLASDHRKSKYLAAFGGLTTDELKLKVRPIAPSRLPESK